MGTAEPARTGDEDLLLRVGAGDDQAFRLVGQAQVAEEMVLEAFLASGGIRIGTTGPEGRSARGGWARSTTGPSTPFGGSRRNDVVRIRRLG